MSVKLLTEHHLEFLSLKGGFTGLSESTLVKMPHCWKSYVTAQIWMQKDLDPNVNLFSRCIRLRRFYSSFAGSSFTGENE